jgi:hypothetical protein
MLIIICAMRRMAARDSTQSEADPDQQSHGPPPPLWLSHDSSFMTMRSERPQRGGDQRGTASFRGQGSWRILASLHDLSRVKVSRSNTLTGVKRAHLTEKLDDDPVDLPRNEGWNSKIPACVSD